jgi:hypothetical protein
MDFCTSPGSFRSRFFFKPLAVALMELVAIMAILPELPVVGSAVAPRAYAQSDVIVINTGLTLNPYGPLDVNPPDPPVTVIGTPCFRTTGQIIQQLCSYVIPPGSLTPFIDATTPSEALKLFESDSVGTYLKTNYMSPDDAPLVYLYGGTEMRGQIRNLMLNRLLKMVGGAPANALERSVYDWFKYQMWLFERTTYETAVAERNAWQSNPCGWRPDPDLTAAYGLNYNPQKFCSNNNTLQGLTGDPPIVPSKAYFLGAAQKKVYGKAVEQGDTNGAAAMARMWLTDGVGAAVSALAGGGLGVGIGVGAKAIWSETLRGVGTGVRNIKPSSFLKIGATGPTIIVTLMIEAGIEMGFRVFEYENAMNELKTLDGDLAAIKKGPSELSRYKGDAGRFKMTQVFAAMTLPEYASTGPFPTHDPLTDPVFYLTPSNTYSDTVTYQDDSGTTFSAKTYKGWFVRQCLTNCDNVAPTAVIPTLDVVNPSGDAWTVARLGGIFGLVKQSPKADEDLCDLLSQAKDPSKCASYISFTAPYLDAAGNAGTFSLVSKPVFTSPSTAYFTQGVPGTLTVTAAGAPSPTISEADLIPSGFSVTPGTGTATVRYDGSAGPGTYSLKLVAANHSSTFQTVTVKVNGVPPSFTSPTVAPFIKGVPGTFTVQATGSPAPALTVGTPHFPPLGLDFVDNGDGTATISGTVPINSPGCGSACSGFINATAPGNVQTQQTLTIDVQSPVLPFLLPTSLVFTAGIEAEGKIVATGSTLGKLANVCQTLPNWMTFQDNGNNTATVSGTPPAGSPSVGLHVIVAPPGVPVDYHCGTLDSPNFTVGVTTKPVLTSPNQTTFTVGSLGSFQVSGVTTDPISLSGTLPAGVYWFPLPASTYGVLSGTPAEGSGGVYPLVLTMGTGANAATQDFTLIVKERPAFVAPYGATFTINQPSSFPITVTGYPKTPVAGQQGMTMQTFTGSLPPGMVLVEALSPLGEHTGSWMLTGTPTTATGRYTATISASNGVGLVRGQEFALDVVPPAVPKLPPIITWPPPAAITYGSALSATQLNATTTIPGTFLYAPPAGTVLPIGSQSLSVTFVPADTDHYGTATTSNYITVNPAPTGTAGKPNLVVTNTLSRINIQGAGVIAVQVRVANTGNAAAENVTLTSVKVGSNLGIPSTQNLGTLLPGTSLQAYFQAPAPGGSGTASSLSITGTYTGGTISSNARIVLP